MDESLDDFCKRLAHELGISLNATNLSVDVFATIKQRNTLLAALQSENELLRAHRINDSKRLDFMLSSKAFMIGPEISDSGAELDDQVQIILIDGDEHMEFHPRTKGREALDIAMLALAG